MVARHGVERRARDPGRVQQGCEHQPAGQPRSVPSAGDRGCSREDDPRQERVLQRGEDRAHHGDASFVSRGWDEGEDELEAHLIEAQAAQAAPEGEEDGAGADEREGRRRDARAGAREARRGGAEAGEGERGPSPEVHHGREHDQHDRRGDGGADAARGLGAPSEHEGPGDSRAERGQPPAAGRQRGERQRDRDGAAAHRRERPGRAGEELRVEQQHERRDEEPSEGLRRAEVVVAHQRHQERERQECGADARRAPQGREPTEHQRADNHEADHEPEVVERVPRRSLPEQRSRVDGPDGAQEPSPADGRAPDQRGRQALASLHAEHDQNEQREPEARHEAPHCRPRAGPALGALGLDPGRDLGTALGAAPERDGEALVDDLAFVAQR